VLTYCFDSALRLLHPVVPFITEELWQKLPGRQAGDLLVVAPWPEQRTELEDTRAEGQFERVKQAIEKIRGIRADYRVPPKTRLSAAIVSRSASESDAFAGERETIMRLAQLERLSFNGEPRGAGAHAVLGDGTEVFVALEGAIDLAQECRRLSAERERFDSLLKSLTAKLSNENFVARAPADVVAKEREKERDWRFQRDVLDGKLKSLGCS
jgi:valyl-tRNA synthetase